MTVDEAKRAHELISTIKATEHILAAYREADEVVISPKKNKRGEPLSPFNCSPNEITLTAAEIGDAIVTALERRIVAMRVELQDLGID